MTAAGRIGVFGGTFDPVHVGHLAIALAALETLPLDRVVFVPARRSPLKSREPVAGPEQRLEMLRLATRGEPRFEVSRIELDREGPSYTADTLEALSGEGRLFLILGADAGAELDRWKDPERVRALATLVVARRPGAAVAAPPGAMTLEVPLMDISARELRARAARARSLRYLVPDPVCRYIEEHALYREDPSPAS